MWNFFFNILILTVQENNINTNLSLKCRKQMNFIRFLEDLGVVLKVRQQRVGIVSLSIFQYFRENGLEEGQRYTLEDVTLLKWIIKHENYWKIFSKLKRKIFNCKKLLDGKLKFKLNSIYILIILMELQSYN